MADHGTVEYTTATGNDYRRTSKTYERFIHLTIVGMLHVVTIAVRPGDRRRDRPLVYVVC